MKFTQSLKQTLIIGTLSITSLRAISSDKTDRNWRALLGENGIAPADQAYCYTDEQGKLQGKNLDLPVRLASVSKLMTSLWAMETLGPNYRYNTKLFIKGNNLHIAGSFDPFFGNEKIFFLISQLNDLGYTKFDKITFDRTIQLNPDAQLHVDEYPLITRATNAKNLKLYFNTKLWGTALRNEYDRLQNLAPEGKLRKNVNFQIGDAIFSDTNPFADDSDAKILTLSSPPLYKYLKEINVKSNNYAIQTIFIQLGGEIKFQEFLAERFSLTTDKIYFWTGNGLPVVIDGARKDNFATCTVTTDLIAALKNSAEKQGREIEDIVAVPGSDGGTFRNRTFSSDYRNAFVAKTGTLVHTSTLAGAMSTKKGFSFFGIFNQSTDIEGSKNVQNGMVESIMTEMGGPKNFNYQVNGFHTYNDADVKNLDIFSNEITDFVSIDQNLY